MLHWIVEISFDERQDMQDTPCSFRLTVLPGNPIAIVCRTCFDDRGAGVFEAVATTLATPALTTSNARARLIHRIVRPEADEVKRRTLAA